MGDSNTVWLNFTNAALGVVVLACLLALALGVVKELVTRRRARKRASDEFDRELRELMASFESDPHLQDQAKGPQ